MEVEKRPKHYKESLIPLKPLHIQRGKMHLTRTVQGWTIPHTVPVSFLPWQHDSVLLRAGEKGQTVRIAKWFYFQFFWLNIWAISLGAPKLRAPLLFPACLNYFTWLLVKAFGIFATYVHCKWQSPLSSPVRAKGAEMIAQRPSEEPGQNPSGLYPPHSLLPGHSPAWPKRTRLLPCQLELGPLLVLICYPGTCGVRNRSFWSERMQPWGIFFFSLSF